MAWQTPSRRWGRDSENRLRANPCHATAPQTPIRGYEQEHQDHPDVGAAGFRNAGPDQLFRQRLGIDAPPRPFAWGWRLCLSGWRQRLGFRLDPLKTDLILSDPTGLE
jgi:hypothetical protein